MGYKVSTKRHLGKTISYSIISTCVGFLSMWYITGNIIIGLSFGFAEIILKPIIYYLHERIWYSWFKFGLIEEKPIKLKKIQLDSIQPKLLTKEPTKLVEKPGKKVLNYSSNR